MVRARLVTEQKPDVELLLTWGEAASLLAELWDKAPFVSASTFSLVYNSLRDLGVPVGIGKV